MTAVLVLLGFLALTYVGYIGPWEQAGPPFYVEETADPEIETDAAIDADSVGAD